MFNDIKSLISQISNNKTNIKEPDKKKKSKFRSYKHFDKRPKRRQEKMKKIRNETRKNIHFNYDRYKFYEDKYIKRFSYRNPTFSNKVTNYQFRNFTGTTTLNTRRDKPKKVFDGGHIWNPYLKTEMENYQFRNFGRRNTALNTTIDKKNDKRPWGVWTNF